MATTTRKVLVHVFDAQGRIAGGYMQTQTVEIFEEEPEASPEYVARLAGLMAQASVALQREFSDTRSIKRPVIARAS